MSQKQHAPPAKVETLALALPVLAALCVAGLWWGIDQHEERWARRQVELMSSQAALRLQDFVRARLLVVQSVANEVSTGVITDEERFVSMTAALQAQLEGFLAINRIDAEGKIIWVSPEGPNRQALGRSVFEHPVAGPFAKRSFVERKVEVTPPLTLYQGMVGFASYFPTSDAQGKLTGAINGVFDAQVLADRALNQSLLGDYCLRITDGDETLFATEGFERAVAALETQRAALIAGREWRVTLRPSPETHALLRPQHHDRWLVLGLGACLVLAGLGLAWRRARRAARELERSRARLETELRHAQKMEALGRLAGGLAHDFNNLLTALVGHAELAKMTEDLDPEVEQSLEDILAVAKRGSEMTRSLLAFSRKQPMQVKRIDPAKQLRQLQRTLRHLVRESVQQEVQLEPGEGVVEMDPTQLDQVVMNLVVNAVDAMPDGGRLGLRVRAEDAPDGAWFVIEVEDTGTGMPKEVQARMFEPFFTTKDKGGTGLGLAQVWDFVRRAGGRVEVDSAPGQGTTVQAWLPRLEGAPDEGAVSTGDHQAVRGAVLLVEDDEEVRRTLSALLRRHGFAVIEAGTVAEAWEAAIEGPHVDILVSDVQLPDGTGPELGARLRERRPQLPLVFCSGNARPVDAERIEALEAPFFGKPFDFGALVSRIEVELDHARVEAASG